MRPSITTGSLHRAVVMGRQAAKEHGTTTSDTRWRRREGTAKAAPRSATWRCTVPSVDSGSNRIVAPLEPPVLSDLSNVPLACHAIRTAIGLRATACSTAL